MDYDFAIIGGGSAGYAAARTAIGLGLKTLLIEGGEKIGGLCILRGCMPSKALIESANRMLTLRRAKEFGLRATGLEAHAEEIVARQHHFIRDFADYRRGQIESGAFDFVRGLAEFVGPHSVVVRWPGEPDRPITARSFLVATGSVIQTPPVPGLAEAAALTSDDALELTTLPSSLAVLGAGPVALEMAHYFSALGVAVTIIQRGPQLLTGSDPDIAHALEDALRKRGITIFTGTHIHGIERTAEGRRIVFEKAGEMHTIACAEILNALGRRPNLDKLGLAAAGIAGPEHRLETNAHQQTSQPHIFAGGDCCGPHEVVHIAVQQGEIAARNAARLLAEKGEPLEAIDDRLNLYAVFTEPQVATVGLNEAAARARGPIRVATYPFDDHGKSLIMGETEGFVKLITDAATGEILGGAVVGPHASDLIHEIVVAMHFRATAAQLAAIPHYHPTLSEIWTYPAEELASPDGND
ncbi:MAG TPA: FAD-dependent oxidoreductase [Chthoniobacterales bacterium]|jgi:pyruvate/2-oxoglutarate dehydrogenase complex dihydrolipoamide dehydrogenase (E3) component